MSKVGNLYFWEKNILGRLSQGFFLLNPTEYWTNPIHIFSTILRHNKAYFVPPLILYDLTDSFSSQELLKIGQKCAQKTHTYKITYNELLSKEKTENNKSLELLDFVLGYQRTVSKKYLLMNKKREINHNIVNKKNVWHCARFFPLFRDSRSFLV